MKTSETTNKFCPAFLAAQKQITFVLKDKKNPFFGSKYADLGSVIDAVKESLNNNGIFFVQSGGAFSSHLMQDDFEDGKKKETALRHVGVMDHTTRLVHESGEWLEETMQVPIAKIDPQGIGSAMTYARRYHLAAMCGLYQDDDDGNAGSGNKSSGNRNEPSTRPSGNYAKDTKNAEAKKEEPKKDDKPKTEAKGPTGKTVKVLEIPLPKDGRELDQRIINKLSAYEKVTPGIGEAWCAVEKSYWEDCEPEDRRNVNDEWSRKDLENIYNMYMKFLESYPELSVPKEYKLV